MAVGYTRLQHSIFRTFRKWCMFLKLTKPDVWDFIFSATINLCAIYKTCGTLFSKFKMMLPLCDTIENHKDSHFLLFQNSPLKWTERQYPGNKIYLGCRIAQIYLSTRLHLASQIFILHNACVTHISVLGNKHFTEHMWYCCVHDKIPCSSSNLLRSFRKLVQR